MFDWLRKRKMLNIKNKTITSYEELKTQYAELINLMSHLQDEKVMKVNKIDKDYQVKIDKIYRTAEMVKDEMERARKYIAPNGFPEKAEIDLSKFEFVNPLDSIIPTPANIMKNAEKSNK